MSDFVIFEDSPTLGKFVKNYPIDRLRLLMIGGGIMAVVWFIVTLTLWNVDERIAAPLNVLIISLTGLAVGWTIVHFWNREVVLYERGFSYREGARLADFAFVDIVTMRQVGEQRLFFGGLITWSNYKFIMLTSEDEVISLSSFYRRFDHLILRLEDAITKDLRLVLDRRLGDGQQIAFGDAVAIDSTGLSIHGDELAWSNLGGYRIQSGHLVIDSKAEPARFRIKLSEVDNIRLLIDVLQDRA